MRSICGVNAASATVGCEIIGGMTKAVAVVLTFGRAALGELLAQLERQTHTLPVLLYVDDAPALRVEAPSFVHVVHGPRVPRAESIGLVRRFAVEAARQRFELRDEDAFLVLDDDDFYCSRHFEATLHALERAPDWTGALAMGLQRWEGDMPPTYLCADAGMGQHATWAVRFKLYDQAGGYIDERQEDVGLGYRMGFRTCAGHRYCTHVRRRHHANMSGPHMRFDRGAMRRADVLSMEARPTWTPELEALEQWCLERF